MERLNEKEERFIKKFYTCLKNELERLEKNPPPYAFELSCFLKKKDLYFLGKYDKIKETLNNLKKKDFLHHYWTTFNFEDKRNISIIFNFEKISQYYELYLKV